MQHLRERAVRAGFAKICSQGGGLVIRFASFVVLARLLDPKDFGLVGMVTAFTEVLNVFRDFGLSAASVQSATVTREQASTLFWINLSIGAMLSLFALALGPLIAVFYHEPRVILITSVIAVSFVLSGATTQHWALLQRQMRFPALAAIDIVSFVIGAAIAIGMAASGYGYWALVAMIVSFPFTTMLGVWLAAVWLPGPPRRGTGIRSMIGFGGTMTLNSLVFHVTYNAEKALLGRYWGAEAVGIYGRAYQLIRIPTDSLNSAVGEVAFAALSRIQHDRQRVKRYFLKCYSAVIALTLPLTIACALFADELVHVVLGPKWNSAVDIFRILAPTILVFGVGNPLGWLLNALGRVDRLLKIGLVSAPLMIAGYVIGLPYGAVGVAAAYSVVMVLKVVPMSAWALRGTGISLLDLLREITRPLASSLAAAALAFGVDLIYGPMLSPFARLAAETTVFGATYLALLLFVAGQKSFYLDLFRALKAAPWREEAV